MVGGRLGEHNKPLLGHYCEPKLDGGPNQATTLAVVVIWYANKESSKLFFF